MPKVSVDEALKKGKIQLLWLPMIIFFIFMIAGIGLLSVSITIGIVTFILSFVASWLWWSFRVVKWKIWAFSNVTDARTLEKKAIAQQIIWPQGNWFEKTEIKSANEKKQLDALYQKINNSTVTKEIVQDNNLPLEMIIKYPTINVYLYLLMIPLGIYLVYVDSLFLGIVCIAGGCWMSFDLYRKISKQKFFIKLDHNGVTLPENFIPWSSIDEYFIERSGYGNSTNYSLIIKGVTLYETIELSDVNTSAFTIERYMDVYRSRFEQINQVAGS